jgi:2-methylcitrate dehydratase PrpD
MTHPALDATENVLAERPLTADEIDEIDIHSGGIARYMAYDDPTNMLSAKFSIPYSVAAAVVMRNTGIEAVRNPALENPAIRELAARVKIHDTPDWASMGASPRVTRIDVKLRNGEVLNGETQFVRGDAANPVDRAVLLGKYRFLAGQRSGDDVIQAIHDRIMHIDQVEDVATLHDVLSGGA